MLYICVTCYFCLFGLFLVIFMMYIFMILVAFGTRPEYIKVKSIIDHFKVKTLFTGQHINLLEGVKVDFIVDQDLNKNKNRLNSIIQNVLQFTVPSYIKCVLVQGDTTSALAVALSAFNQGLPIIHLEAGLRTNDIYDPYPEEMNRQLISRIASIHLCPTELNKHNLLKENVYGKIYVVGNTGLDNINKEDCFYGDTVLVTMHRRDNHPIMDMWFKSLATVSEQHLNLKFVFPVHPNPNVQKHKHILQNRVNIDIIDPVSHTELINLMKSCKFVVTDSGGLQEEASFLNKKVIICRNSTERPEVLEWHGTICPTPDLLMDVFNKVNSDYIVDKPCPFGDGKSYKKVKKCLQLYL